jgi:predicted metal-dependent peptidase
VLTRCDKQAGRTTGAIIGGGGTELSLAQVQQIRGDLKLSDNEILDVVYVTDGYVDLREIQADKKTRLHVVLNRDGEVEAPMLV